MNSEKIYNCGIVGYGYMGEIRRRVIANHPNLNLYAICETNDSVRSSISDCKTVASVDELLIDEVDIIFVCTPNNIAPAICVKAFQKGKHVFCEKPPGRHVDDIKEIIENETPENKLMFGFNHRFHPGIQRAKAVIESGMLGQVVGVRGVYGKSGGNKFHQSWRNDKDISGGGILLDQGIHMLDLFVFFCGDFQQVKAFTSNKYWQFDVEDNACVILKNDQGQVAMLHSSATQWKHKFSINIILEKGYLIVQGLLSKTGSYGRETLIIGKQQFEDETQAVGNPSEEIVYFDNDTSWDMEVAEFVRCVDQNKVVTTSNSEDAYKVMRIVQAAYEDAAHVTNIDADVEHILGKK